MAVSLIAAAAPADALPSFARKHSMACSRCHAIYPKLTPLGRRFKENGFRLPDDESSWRDLARSVPGSLDSSFQDSFSSDDGGAEAGTLKPVAAGSLSSWVSFWMDWPTSISSEDGEDERREHYWVQFNDVLRRLRSGILSVKAGQFELDLPFTQARTYNLFPYTPYFLTGPYQKSIAAPQRGIEFSGRLGRGLRYSAAVVDVVALETPSFEDDYSVATFEVALDPDLYLRVSKTFQETHRVGIFAYRADNSEAMHEVGKISSGPFPFDFEVALRDHVKLLGTDIDWRFDDGRFNLFGLFLLGQKDLALDTFPFEATDLLGGFVQLDTRLLDSLTIVSRYNLDRSETLLQMWYRDPADPPHPSRRTREDRQSLTLGLQWWAMERLKFAFEYLVFVNNITGPRGALSVDLVL